MTAEQGARAALGARDAAGFLPREQYDLVRASVPITCVDLLPMAAERPSRVGLILRETYGGETGWCLVGGRVLRDEPLTEAVLRHVRATLGPEMNLDLASLSMCTVVEYFSSPGMGEFHDPRKHAIALTYVATCAGEPRPQGEALEFGWFGRSEIDGLRFGFRQDRVVRAALAHLDSSGSA